MIEKESTLKSKDIIKIEDGIIEIETIEREETIGISMIEGREDNMSIDIIKNK